MNTAILSVIMITYGHENYIKQAIEGVLMQECDFEIELIVANDASPDDTNSVVNQIINNHPRRIRVKYTEHKDNKGANENFLWATQQCKGKYIALCEGDDYWTDPLKLQKQVDFLEANEEYVLTGHERILVTENGEQLKDKNKNKADYYTQCLVFKNVLKDDFLNYDTINIVNGDTFLILYLNNFGKSIILDFIGSAYRISSSGVWSTLNADIRYKLAHESLKSMFIFFKKYNYFKSAKTVNLYLLDNEIRYFHHTGNISYLGILKLFVSCIWLRDLNRLKSVIKLLVFRAL